MAPAISESSVLEKELNWLSEVLNARFNLYFGLESEVQSIQELPAPELEPEEASAYGQLLLKHDFGFEERAVLALALAPHLKPRLLDLFFTKNANFDRPYTEFGGYKGHFHGGFLPTGETAAFMLAGDDLEGRNKVQQLFGRQHVFGQTGLLKLQNAEKGEPLLSGPLHIDPDLLQLIYTGSNNEPGQGAFFPAKHISTKLNWEDLVLTPATRVEVDEIIFWIQQQGVLLKDWGLDRLIPPGYRSLFYGPPGTGKTLTATLLGKSTGLDVYRIDLSMVVSKYIGETEKNLSQVFDQGERRNWILFFDEADALFGKRTATSSSHDRYANQETAYLLQRIEDYPGVVILASNLKSNLDDAFARRFQSMIHFPMPKWEERYQLWENAFSGKCRAGPEVDFAKLSKTYELSGGAIINVLRTAALQALARKGDTVSEQEIVNGIRKELRKENKTI